MRRRKHTVHKIHMRVTPWEFRAGVIDLQQFRHVHNRFLVTMGAVVVLATGWFVVPLVVPLVLNEDVAPGLLFAYLGFTAFAMVPALLAFLWLIVCRVYAIKSAVVLVRADLRGVRVGDQPIFEWADVRRIHCDQGSLSLIGEDRRIDLSLELYPQAQITAFAEELERVAAKAPQTSLPVETLGALRQIQYQTGH